MLALRTVSLLAAAIICCTMAANGRFCDDNMYNQLACMRCTTWSSQTCCISDKALRFCVRQFNSWIENSKRDLDLELGKRSSFGNTQMNYRNLFYPPVKRPPPNYMNAGSGWDIPSGQTAAFGPSYWSTWKGLMRPKGDNMLALSSDRMPWRRPGQKLAGVDKRLSFYFDPWMNRQTQSKVDPFVKFETAPEADNADTAANSEEAHYEFDKNA